MNVYVVNVALRAVEDDAVDVIKHLLDCFTNKSGPVCRYLAAADGVGVICKIYERDAVSALAVKSDNVYAVINLSDGMENVGVIYAGVSAYCAVLHSITANESDIFSFSNSVAHFSGLEVLECGEGNVYQIGLPRANPRGSLRSPS